MLIPMLVHLPDQALGVITSLLTKKDLASLNLVCQDLHLHLTLQLNDIRIKNTLPLPKQWKKYSRVTSLGVELDGWEPDERGRYDSRWKLQLARVTSQVQYIPSHVSALKFKRCTYYTGTCSPSIVMDLASALASSKCSKSLTSLHFDPREDSTTTAAADALIAGCPALQDLTLKLSSEDEHAPPEAQQSTPKQTSPTPWHPQLPPGLTSLQLLAPSPGHEQAINMEALASAQQLRKLQLHQMSGLLRKHSITQLAHLQELVLSRNWDAAANWSLLCNLRSLRAATVSLVQIDIHSSASPPQLTHLHTTKLLLSECAPAAAQQQEAMVDILDALKTLPVLQPLSKLQSLEISSVADADEYEFDDSGSAMWTVLCLLPSLSNAIVNSTIEIDTEAPYRRDVAGNGIGQLCAAQLTSLKARAITLAEPPAGDAANQRHRSLAAALPELLFLGLTGEIEYGNGYRGPSVADLAAALRDHPTLETLVSVKPWTFDELALLLGPSPADWRCETRARCAGWCCLWGACRSRLRRSCRTMQWRRRRGSPCCHSLQRTS